MKASVLFRCDASSAIGYGHLMRGVALAERFQAHGDDVTFLIHEDAGASRVISRAGVPARWMPGSAGMPEVLTSIQEEIRKRARQDGPRVWAVVDSYEDAAAQTRCAREADARVLVVDDWGRVDHAAHVLVNPNVDAAASWYPGANGTRLLLGASYAFVRQEFMGQAVARDRSAPVRRVVVTLGGGDLHHQVMAVLRGLEVLSPAQRAGLDVDVVLGHGYREADQAVAFAQTAPYRCHVRQGVFDIAALMSRADLAISGAGGTLYELAYLGVPTVALTLSDSQVRNAQAFAARGAAVSLGMADQLTPAWLAAAVEPVLSDPHRRRTLSERGRALCDGHGPERIREAMDPS